MLAIVSLSTTFSGVSWPALRFSSRVYPCIYCSASRHSHTCSYNQRVKTIYTISNLFWLTNLYELELSSYLIIEPWLQHMVVKQKICWSWYQSTIHTLCRLMNTLLPKSFCSLEHFASQLTLLSTLYSSAHFAPQHTLITGVLCSLEHFALWNNLLPGTLYFLEHFALSRV